MGFSDADRKSQIVAQPAAAQASSADGFQAKAVFEAIEEGLKLDGENLVKKVHGVYCFKVTKGPNGEDASWIVDVKNGNGSVSFNGNAKPDCTITMTDTDLVDLMMGKIDPQRAFFQGKLKIAGNMGLALKLQQFTQKMPKAKL